MNAKRGRRLDRRTAERVAGGDWTAGGPGLQALLSAASGPARPDELAREDATVAAFRTARAGAVVAVVETTPPRRRVMIKTIMAKLLTTKIAVAAAATAAVTVGGVATVAATTSGTSTGDGTGTGGSAGVRVTTSVSAAAGPSRSEARESGEHPSGAYSGEQAGERPATQPEPDPSPDPTGLCHAYTAGAGADHGKALDNPAFTVLITTAGGRDKVDGYCAALLDDHSASATPTSTGKDLSGTHPGSDLNVHATVPAHPSH